VPKPRRFLDDQLCRHLELIDGSAVVHMAGSPSDLDAIGHRVEGASQATFRGLLCRNGFGLAALLTTCAVVGAAGNIITIAATANGTVLPGDSGTAPRHAVRWPAPPPPVPCLLCRRARSQRTAHVVGFQWCQHHRPVRHATFVATVPVPAGLQAQRLYGVLPRCRLTGERPSRHRVGLHARVPFQLHVWLHAFVGRVLAGVQQGPPSPTLGVVSCRGVRCGIHGHVRTACDLARRVSSRWAATGPGTHGRRNVRVWARPRAL